MFKAILKEDQLLLGNPESPTVVASKKVRRWRNVNTVPERVKASFWANVEVSSPHDCWFWLGRRFAKTGYGAVSYGRPIKDVGAHCVAYILSTGPIPHGGFICHTCDNPLCVNPKHLFLGDHDLNMADRQAKGRQMHGDRHHSHLHPECRPRGSAHGNAKLTEEMVIQAWRLKKEEGYSAKKLAQMFGVWPTTIEGIFKGKSWRHVQPEAV